MSAKIKDNTNIIILDTQRKSSEALRYMLEDIHQIANPMTPKDKGYLRSNVLKSVLGLHGSIKWGQKYASRLETKKFINYTTSGTGPHYAEKSVKVVAGSPMAAFRKARLI